MKFLFNIILLQFFTLLLYSQGIVITSGIEIEFAGNPYFIIRDGGLVNNGVYTKASEELMFTGSVADSINGEKIDAHNISIINSGGIKTKADTIISYDLDIGASSSFTLEPTKFVSVSNALTNSAGVSGLTLKADNTGSSSLISTSSGVSATVQRFMRGDRWYIVSSSTPGQSIINFLANNDSIPHAPSFRAMTFYDETLGRWADYLTDTSPGNMDAGEGFLVRTTKDTVLYFEGTIQNSTVSGYSLAYTTRGWHSVGNPFSSSLMIAEAADLSNNFLSINLDELDPEYVAIYVWDEQANYSNKNRNDFVALNLLSDTAYLQPGQGFLLKANSSGSSIDFTRAMRIHYNQTIFTKKSSRKSTKSQIKLHVSNATSEASTHFYFVDYATSFLDPGYDAGLYGALSNFSLYSHLVNNNGNKFMIQALSNSEFHSISIPLGFDCTEESTVSFRAETNYLGFEGEVILEDRELNIFTNLKKPTLKYSVDIPAGTEGTGRFYLHTYDPRTLGIEGFESLSNLQIYSVEKEILIKGNIPENSNFYIYDLMGRSLKIINLPADSNTSVQVPNLSTGVYIVRISDGKSEETQRVFIR